MSDEPTEIDSNGTRIWRNSEGEIHRDSNVPARIWTDGTLFYYQNGLIHRNGDLPAVIHPDGHCQWWQNGDWHRDYDLPAKIYSDGRCEWWINGKFIKRKKCIKEEIEEYKKPHYLQRNNVKFNRFEKIIK